MKRISAVAVVTIAVSIGIMTWGQQHNTTSMLGAETARTESVTGGQEQGSAIGPAWACTTSCQSYEVVEAASLDELKKRVRQGLDKADWQPQGGIAYNSETKHYLQVMIHPRPLPSYP
jgi:hypothetical protein